MLYADKIYISELPLLQGQDPTEYGSRSTADFG
jgi:hypothetical protein